jgi:hypothetical protein
MRLPPVEKKIAPAMVMCGTTPVLYKSEITAEAVQINIRQSAEIDAAGGGPRKFYGRDNMPGG